MEKRSAPDPGLVAVANHPRRLLHPHDDASVGAIPVGPSAALLDGIPGRIPRDHLLFPLLGLLVSREPRDHALSPTPGRQALPRHGDTVVNEPCARDVASLAHGSLLPSPIAPEARQFQGTGSHLQRVVRRGSCYHPGGGMPRSRQIFFANSSLISVCRGTADRRWLAELPHQECLTPSRTRLQPCALRCAIRCRRLTDECSPLRRHR